MKGYEYTVDQNRNHLIENLSSTTPQLPEWLWNEKHNKFKPRLRKYCYSARLVKFHLSTELETKESIDGQILRVTAVIRR